MSKSENRKSLHLLSVKEQKKELEKKIKNTGDRMTEIAKNASNKDQYHQYNLLKLKYEHLLVQLRNVRRGLPINGYSDGTVSIPRD